MKRKLPPTPPKDMANVKRTKTTKKATKKKSWVLRRGFSTANPVFPGRSVFPYQRFATLKYCEAYVTVNPPVGSSSAFIMRANDVYDPNVTGVGHQPTGFDQYMAMYNKFVVYDSKIKVVAYATDTEILDTVVGVAVMDSATTQSTTENYLEQPLTDWRVVPAGNGANPVSFSTAFDATAFSGTSIKTNDLLHGTASAPPGKQWYYHIFCGSTGTAEDPGPMKYSIEVEYLVKFFEPKSQTIS